MSEEPVWWQHESERVLAEILAHMNSARERESPVDKCRDLFDALNKLWNAYYQFRKRQGLLTSKEQGARSDHQSFTQLLLTGLRKEDALAFSDGMNLRQVVGLAPPVMDMHTLQEAEYDPQHIPDKLRKEASNEHGQLAGAYARHRDGGRGNQLHEALLKKLAQFLYVVRSNIAHGEKTPRGPDLRKAQRDRDVCSVTAPLVEELLDWLLLKASTHLAVYGTLSQGGVNASVLDGI